MRISSLPAAGNFNNADFGGTISDWLICPTLNLFDGETLSFFMRATLAPFVHRLEIRLSLVPSVQPR